MSNTIKRILGFAMVVSSLAFTIQNARADSVWTAYTTANSPLPSDYVSGIDFDSDGNQYVGTTGGGVALIKDSVWTIWNQSNTGVPIDAARLAVRDSDNNLWLGAASGNLDASPYGSGVARLDGLDSSWSMVNHGIEVNQIVTGIIFEDTLRYVSTYGGGVTVYSDSGWIRYRYDTRTEFRYSDSSLQVFNVPPGTYLPSDYIRAMDRYQPEGAIWFATATGGAVRKIGSDWVIFNSGNSGLPSNQLWSIRVNQVTGDVIFGTAGFGLAIMSGSDWTVYNSSNSPLTNNFIASIGVKPSGDELWIGTGYGVWVLEDDGDWRSYLPDVNNFIWGEFYSDIAFDSIGMAWVSAYGGGMASLQIDSLPQPPPPDSLEVDVNKMFIFFFHWRPVERLFTKIQVDNAPELSDPDTISLELETDLGELYEFNVLFDDFHRSWFNWGGRTKYWYIEDWLMIWLSIKNNDHSDIKVMIIDLDADMNRDNFDFDITAIVRMGDRYGVDEVSLGWAHQEDVVDLNVEGEANTAQAYGYGDPAEPTGIDWEQTRDDIKLGFHMSNYPNPFNGSTTISFSLPDAGMAEVSVYDILGRQVSSIYSGYLPAGNHQYAWPVAGDETPKSGIYYYRISVDDRSETGKMMFLK